MNMNWVNRMIHLYGTQLQPLDFKDLFLHFAFLLPLLCFLLPVPFLIRKSTLTTRISHDGAATHSSLSEIDYFCLAVLRVSCAIMELHTSLITIERKKIHHVGMFWRVVNGKRTIFCKSYKMLSRCNIRQNNMSISSAWWQVISPQND